MTLKNTILALALLAAASSCNGPEMLRNTGFEEASALAKAKNRPLCIVLVDDMQYLSDEFAWTLHEEHPRLARRAVFDIVDIGEPAHDRFLKWFCPTSVPLTCVFSPAGHLVDVIPGEGKESFASIGQAVERMTATGFRWPNRFERDKADVLPVLRDLLDNERLISAGIFLPRKVAPLVDSLEYPYSLALRLAGEMMTGDSLSARATAAKLLEKETPYNLSVYQKEFVTAHMVLDPDFDIGDEPAIRVGSETIDLGERPADRPVPLNIEVHNYGGKPLTLSDVIPDCSCIRRLGGGEVVIAPRDSVSLSFVLAPYAEGAISKNILLVSNGINKPLLNINILATFKP